MKLIQKVYDLLQKKSIPEKDFKIIIAGFNASAVTTAMHQHSKSVDITNVTDVFPHFEEIGKIVDLLEEDGLKDVSSAQIKSKLSQKDIAFLQDYKKELDKLLLDFIEKLEKL